MVRSMPGPDQVQGFAHAEVTIMDSLKPLPDGYWRKSVVAWVVAVRDGHKYLRDGRTKVPRIVVDTQPLYVVTNDYECTDVDYDREPRPQVTIIPAIPGTFTIMMDDDVGSIEFCYEINGVFTDYEFNEKMRGV